MYIRNNNSRLYIIFSLFNLILLFISARILYIQFFQKDFLTELANKQHNVYLTIEPNRGVIFDRNLKPQTANINLKSLYAVPRDMSSEQKKDVAAQLSEILKMDKELIVKKLSQDKAFVWIKRKLTPEVSREVERLDYKHLGFIKESMRTYPNDSLAAHIIGYAGLDNCGLEGIELKYNKYLQGTPGREILIRDAQRKYLPLLDEHTIPPKEGYNIVLTIDESIQYIAERELDKVFTKYKAKGASVVVMNPRTGEILALANRPTFNPNDINGSQEEGRRNRAVSDYFEPGSVFKIVTAAAALEEQAVTEEDVFYCEKGSYKVGNHILHDHRPHGNLTFRQVIEKSSNIGTTKVAQLLGEDKVFRYVKLFGFGDLTGINLPGEVQGVVRSPKYWSKTSIGAIPIGHEVTVTALQLASSISVIANGGWLMKPYIVDRIMDLENQTIKDFKPEPVRRVISEDTAARLRDILTGVVQEGTGKMARLKDYIAAGKTGTAQKIDPQGGYSHSQFIASFIGFVPAENPVLTIIVTVDDPHPVYYGGVVAAPVFKEIAEDALRYLEVLPESVKTNEIAKAH